MAHFDSQKLTSLLTLLVMGTVAYFAATIVLSIITFMLGLIYVVFIVGVIYTFITQQETLLGFNFKNFCDGSLRFAKGLWKTFVGYWNKFRQQHQDYKCGPVEGERL